MKWTLLICCWNLVLGLANLQVVAADFSDLSELFNSESQIWKTSRKDFLMEHSEHGFQWLSDRDKKTAATTMQSLRFLDSPVLEASAVFDDHGLYKMKLSLFNRGDSGDLAKAEFQQQVERVQDRISRWCDIPGTAREPVRRSSLYKVYRMSWVRNDTRIVLEWSSTKRRKINRSIEPYRAEFIRIRMSPRKRDWTRRRRPNAETNVHKKVSYRDVRGKVTRDGQSNIYLQGIPMVDQGQKAYCAVATMSRIMGYYGKDVDQHEMAQIAGTSFLGTNPDQMIEVLKKVSTQFGVRVRTHERIDVDAVIDLIKKYNRLAKREKLPIINLGREIDLGAVYDAMDPDLLRSIRTRKKYVVDRFFREINQQIDVGVPLAWSVMLGIAEEIPPIPQALGGHMRLIIGYNSESGTVIYTDSWGTGHEFKRMSVNDAWTITTGLYTIEPLSRK